MDIIKFLEKLEEEAKIMKYPIIGRIKGKVLEAIIKKYKIKKILEIGTLIGYSAILMGKEIKKGKVTTIEINKEIADIAKKNIEKANLSDKIEVIVGDAKEVIKVLNEEYDMLFIDAEKSEYLTYLKLAEKIIKKGGIIVADNVKKFENEMKDYLEYVRYSGKYKSYTLDLGFDALEISFKLF